MSKLAGAAKHPLAVVVYVLTAALPGFLEWLEERDTSTEVHLEQKIRDLQEAAIHQNIQANAEDIEALHDQCVTYEDLFTMYDEGSPTRRPVRRSARRGGGGTGGSRPGASGPQRPGTAAVDGPGEGTAETPLERLMTKAAEAARAEEDYGHVQRPALRKAADVRQEANAEQVAF
ncbi:hypothetical protein LCGC14_0320460 [marine sediment metagenome]|uniref:Uncharacterized protein n=1 Tax=marine sediment metagenome TaxID=412755 RepID=A0A0F9WRQ0_9ZZZZ